MNTLIRKPDQATGGKPRKTPPKLKEMAMKSVEVFKVLTPVQEGRKNSNPDRRTLRVFREWFG